MVHKTIAEKALPVIEKRLKEKQVEIRGCQTVCRILPDAVPATEQDWATEYLGYTLAIRVVDDIHQAIDHIMTYTTGHSECIVTESYTNAMLFTSQIDAAAVYVKRPPDLQTAVCLDWVRKSVFLLKNSMQEVLWALNN